MNRVIELAKKEEYLSKAIEKILDTNVFPKRPQEPKLNTFNPTKEQLDYYQQALDTYPILVDRFLRLREEYREENKCIQAEIKEAIWEDTGLNFIPEQYREKVWNLAWNEKHSHGYVEVISFLYNLVEVFQ